MTQAKHPDLSWVVGRTVSEVRLRQPGQWCFLLGAKEWVTAECPWRILRGGRITLSSDDHAQTFGSPVRIDAAGAATALLASARITAVEVRAGAADLVIDFAGDLRLEVIPLSSGYESWQLGDPVGDTLVAQGGGNIVRVAKE
jgi:hypothetical protein